MMGLRTAKKKELIVVDLFVTHAVCLATACMSSTKPKPVGSPANTCLQSTTEEMDGEKWEVDEDTMFQLLREGVFGV